MMLAEKPKPVDAENGSSPIMEMNASFRDAATGAHAARCSDTTQRPSSIPAKPSLFTASVWPPTMDPTIFFITVEVLHQTTWHILFTA